MKVVIVLDRVLARAFADGRDLRLTLVEYRLLSYLAHVGEWISKGELMKEVFGLNFIPETNTLAVQLSRLRDKVPDRSAIVTSKDNRYRVICGSIEVER